MKIRRYFIGLMLILMLVSICACNNSVSSNETELTQSSDDIVSNGTVKDRESEKLELLLQNVDKDAVWYGDNFVKCMEAVSKHDNKPQQVKAVHDWLIKNVSLYTDKVADVPAWTLSAEGAFVQKKATCAGYNSAFALCMGVIGVPCERIEGQFNGSASEWVTIELDGSWYHIDVVADDTYDGYGDKVSYDYFNVTDEELSANHTWNKVRECKDTKYSYYDYYYNDKKILSDAQFVDYMADNCDSKEVTVVIKKEVLSEDELRDYEEVSEKCGKLVLWRVHEVMRRGNYIIYRMYMDVQADRIYPDIVHNPEEYYDIVNAILKGGYGNRTVVVIDEAFEKSKYTAFSSKYSDQHDKYVKKTDVYKTSITSSSYIDTNMEKVASAYNVISLDVGNLQYNSSTSVATTTAEFIDYVVSGCENVARQSEHGTFSTVGVTIVVKDSDEVTEDIRVVENGLKNYYPKAYIDKGCTRMIHDRNGYTVWGISIGNAESP